MINEVGIENIYDAMCTIALALNASISTLEGKDLGRLEEYHSESTEMSRLEYIIYLLLTITNYIANTHSI